MKHPKFWWLCSSPCNAQKRQPVASSFSKMTKKHVSSNICPIWSTFWYIDAPDEFPSFLHQNSGKDDNERILIFGDTTMKNLLSLSITWLAEGTFKISLEIFHQFCTIHVELHGFAPPCVYVLLPKKNREKTITEWMNCWVKKPIPGNILADFGQATLNAFSRKFAHTKIPCCYFHLTQSVNR